MRTENAPNVGAYVASARRLEVMALDLAQRNVDEQTAVHALIEAAEGEVRVMRRAHRHSEFAISEQWPAGPELIRALDYLSIGRRELEKKRSQILEVAVQPPTKPIDDSDAGRLRMDYDLVDEASMGSFPASDAPSFWAR